MALELLDWIWPTLVNTKEIQESEAKKLKEQDEEIALRVGHLALSSELLDGYLKVAESMLDGEGSRRSSVESRLMSIAGLMSIAATVVLGTLFSLATDKDLPPIWGASCVGPLVCVYLALQLTAAIHAAIKGLQAADYISERPQDVLPSPDQWGAEFRRERIDHVLRKLAQHRSVNNLKVGQLKVAHTAVRNFLWGLLLAAIFVAALAVFRTRTASPPASKPCCTSAPPASSVPPAPKETHVLLRRIATVGPFSTGSHMADTERVVACLRALVEDVAQVGEIRGWQIIGRTDRRNLKPQTARTYGSNEALAMARAGTVRDLMSAAVPQFHDDRAMVAIGGPDSYVSTSSEEAMRADRAVDIFILLDSSQELRSTPRLCPP